MNGLDRFGKGGTGGAHVVEQQHVFIIQGMVLTEGKDVAKVFLPFLGREGGLADVRPTCAERELYREAYGIGEAYCNLFRLVIPPLGFLEEMHGDGDYDIYVGEETGGEEFTTHRFTHEPCQTAEVPVLEILNKLRNLRSGGIEEVAGGSLEREESGKTHLHRVPFLAMIERSRQSGEAWRTHISPFLGREGDSAYMAYTRKYEI